jgi:CRISPR-associated endonuclease/helicase Cas3
MPTQATSNQMFERVVRFLKERYPEAFVTVNLAHSQALLQEELLKLRLHTIGEDEQARIAAMSWFMANSKRTLLAPFGVGTVDQALLSVLQTKHFFVRLFGLHQRVVIFVEVHAYDMYMSTIFEQLLGWLGALGTPVILLSATLPSETRRKLVKAYCRHFLSGEGATYPSLTIAGAGRAPQTFALPAPEDYTIELAWLFDRSPAAVVESLAGQLRVDGCAAVVCNTVRRAQEIYQALQAACLVPEEHLILFHARFPPAWRQDIEEKVLTRFSKPREDGKVLRPQRAIVVATQVVEQSLDLDFDLLFSELAPVDLMIQRAGRLHRHDRGSRLHPRCLTILGPQLDSDGLPQFGVDGLVYEPYVLLQSYLALQDREDMHLPKETVALIEAVYAAATPSHDQPAWAAALKLAYQTMLRRDREAQAKASLPLILDAGNKYLLGQTVLRLEEDDPAVHQTLQARTRDIGPSVALIGLFATPAGLALEPDGRHSIDLEGMPTPELTQLLHRYAIHVTHWGAVQHFGEQPVPSGWQRSPVLRHCHPVIFQEGGYNFMVDERRYVMRLSRELGLEIVREEI